MRIYTSAVVFPVTFAQVAQGACALTAVWQKYPNPYAGHVHAVDVLDRHICPTTGKITTERILTVAQSAPWWIRRLIGAHGNAYVYEQVVVDPARPAVRLASAKCVPAYSLSFSQYLPVREHIEYAPHGASETLFDQRAAIECKGIRGQADEGLLSSLALRIEDAVLHRFAENAARGRDGFSHALSRLFGGEREWTLLATSNPT